MECVEAEISEDERYKYLHYYIDGECDLTVTVDKITGAQSLSGWHSKNYCFAIRDPQGNVVWTDYVID